MFGLFCIGMAISTTQLIYDNVSTIDSISAKTRVYQIALHDPSPPESRSTGPLRVWLPANPAPGEVQRCFAIVKTNPGENPWRLNSTYENFCESLGGGPWWSWFALWGVQRPGTGGGVDGWYNWNPEILGRLRAEAGIWPQSGGENDARRLSEKVVPFGR